MKLPLDLLWRSPEEGARRIALQHLDQARAAFARLSDPDDSEALHDFRVAIRRLRSAARSWRPELDSAIGRSQRKSLRELQTATGQARDAEVALAWLSSVMSQLKGRRRQGARWLIERLEARVRREGEPVAPALGESFAHIDAELSDRLARVRVEFDLRGDRSARLGVVYAERVRRTTGEFLGGMAALAGAEDREAAHAARILCKRLRYLVEPARELVPEAAPVVQRCQKLQDLLGELNDAHTLRGELAESLRVAAEEQAERLHHLARTGGDPMALRRELGRGARAGLLELTRLVQARIGEADARLQAQRDEEAHEALVRDTESLARRLEAGGDREREVKLLLDRMPHLPEQATASEIEQGWLPGQRILERLRRVRDERGERFFRTIKLGRGIERVEIEEEIDGDLFAALWPLTRERRVRKVRHFVPDGPWLWEIDVFRDRDLVLAEVELGNAATAPEPPAWLAPHVVRDVTNDPAYTNVNLAVPDAGQTPRHTGRAGEASSRSRSRPRPG